MLKHITSRARSTSWVAILLMVVGVTATTAMLAPVAVAGADEEMQEQAATIRKRIADLRHRPECSLTVDWQRYTALMEATLSYLARVSSDRAQLSGRDRREAEAEFLQHLRGAWTMLNDVDMFIEVFEWHSAEACRLYDDANDAERTGQEHAQQARKNLRAVADAIRGDKFPFRRLRDFEEFYKDVNWNDHKRGDDILTMWSLDNSAKQIYDLVRFNTSVNGGRVRVTLPRGRQNVQPRFDRGVSVPFFGDSLERNWLYWSVSETFHRGTLQTGRFEENCARKRSANHCYGHVLGRFAGNGSRGRYRLSTMVSMQMQSALQAHVTATCEQTVANQETLRDFVIEHEPADVEVRRAYGPAANRFVAEIAQVARSGAGRLCSVATGSTVAAHGRLPWGSGRSPGTGGPRLLDLVDLSLDVTNRQNGPGVIERVNYDKFSPKLQSLVDALGRVVLERHTLPFSPIAAPEPARTASFGAGGGDRRHGLENGASDTGSANADPHPAGVLASALNRAARAFAAIVAMETAGDDTAEAIAARQSVRSAADAAAGHAHAAEAAAAARRSRAGAAAAERAIYAAHVAQDRARAAQAAASE